MTKKAIIFDLDNTIYAVHSIGDEVFGPLLALIGREKTQASEMEAIRKDIMRRPFQLVAKEHRFSEALTQKGIEHLKDLYYRGKIEPFEDYAFTRLWPVDKFLVTTGFLKLQQSKIDGMKIGPDFKEIHIVDPATSTKTKKDVFAGILEKHAYDKAEVLVIGDDLHSEIKAAQELGIDVVLYDKLNLHPGITSIPRIGNFKDMELP